MLKSILHHCQCPKLGWSLLDSSKEEILSLSKNSSIGILPYIDIKLSPYTLYPLFLILLFGITTNLTSPHGSSLKI